MERQVSSMNWWACLSVSPAGTALIWVIACLFGAGMAIAAAAITIALPGVNEDRVIGLAFAPTLVISTAGAQFVVLSTHFRRPWGWFPASLAGWILAFGVMLLASRWLPWGIAGSAAFLSCVGFSLGLTQWVYLRRHLRYAAWWIPGMAAGFLVLALIIGRAFTSLASLWLIGLLPGISSGAALGMLLARQPARDTDLSG
jgi:hypothetical protein